MLSLIVKGYRLKYLSSKMPSFFAEEHCSDSPVTKSMDTWIFNETSSHFQLILTYITQWMVRLGRTEKQWMHIPLQLEQHPWREFYWPKYGHGRSLVRYYRHPNSQLEKDMYWHSIKMVGERLLLAFVGLGNFSWVLPFTTNSMLLSSTSFAKYSGYLLHWT